MDLRYQNGKIYMIKSNQTDKVYIGSTIQSLNERLSEHKKSYKRWQAGKYGFVTSFKFLEYDDCYIELLKEFPCNSKKELEREEGKYIREMDCVNQCIAGRTKKEYYQSNKEKAKEYNKEYQQLNKEKIAKRKKQYYQLNKEKINEKRSVKFICPCGGKYRYSDKARHIKSIKHKTYSSQ